MTSPRASQEAIQIARLEERTKAQDIEIRDLKGALIRSQEENGETIEKLTRTVEKLSDGLAPLVEIQPQLKLLLVKASEVDGMTKLAQFLLGGGVLVALGAALAGIWRWFANGG